MICLQLYAKETDGFPGESAAFSILSRQLNGQGAALMPDETKFQDLVRRLCAWRDLMARVHDESTRYILSDYAVVALSEKVPTTQADIYGTIIQADLNIDSSNLSSSLQSPSSLICSHWIDVHQLIQDKIYTNDGQLLCYCDRRKLEWYLRRDLAKLVDDDPPAIMLLFEPKGRPEDEYNDFYIQSKKNICVGCGEGNHYLRYRVIPSCYRVHFPEHLKSHRSHDIVLLCVDCHEVAHAAAEKYKRRIAGEFGIPLYVRKVVDSNQAPIISGSSESKIFEDSGVSPLQLRTAAKALLRHGPEMPPRRRDELTQIVKRYYGGMEISNEGLERALVVGMSPHERRRLEKKNVSHSAKVDTLKEASGTKDELDFCMVKDDHKDNPSTCFDSRVTTACNDMSPHSSQISETRSVCAVNTDNSESSTLNEIADSSCTRYEGNKSFKHNKKLSLLGHGPHGKQVVNHILNECGEEGIRQFCKQWRQVFVESVHPRFLPGGWDVMHSGRQEFGEFGVYNPAKKGANGS
ncbi:hypothetical protein V6N13_110194 [Hibiscus sabdariffa]